MLVKSLLQECLLYDNPKPQWLKATKFSFLLTLEPGRRPGSACSVTQADEEAPVLGVPNDPDSPVRS